jgi:hypothetical protein
VLLCCSSALGLLCFERKEEVWGGKRNSRIRNLSVENLALLLKTMFLVGGGSGRPV